MVDFPFLTLRVLGLALMEKVAGAGSFTVMLTVAGAELTSPSNTVKVKLSGPV